MAELYWKKRWVHLLALIEGLPTHSRYMEAVYNDEELAEQILDSGQGEPSGEYHPPLSIWTPELAMLADISDKLSAIQATQVGVAGGKSKNPKPTPRPETAIERAKQRRSQAVQENIIDVFSPKK